MMRARSPLALGLGARQGQRRTEWPGISI